MGLKRMLERLGLAKTHLELKKMMSEVIGGASKDTISYHDFLNMMLGKRNAILKLWVHVHAILKRFLGNSKYLENDQIHLVDEKKSYLSCLNIVTCYFSLWRILMFEGMGKEQESKDEGPPRRKTFSDLPWLWPTLQIWSYMSKLCKFIKYFIN